MQVEGRMGGVMGMILAVRVRSTKWVGKMQLDERTGGMMGMRLAVMDSCPR